MTEHKCKSCGYPFRPIGSNLYEHWLEIYTFDEVMEKIEEPA